MVESLGREIQLTQLPKGMPSESDFAVVHTRIPEPGFGEVLVRNLYLSVDPYMRYLMGEVGQPLVGSCVGVVVKSQGSWFQPGDYVCGMKGWREYFASDGSDLFLVDPSQAPLPYYLGALGMPGLTAYVGLLAMGCPAPGETVFVSAAAGAVGSVVCQLARIMGCRVVASAGSDQKVKWLLDEAGVGAAFNYKDAKGLSAQLGEACANGIDVYFDNVGGEQLAAAMEHMNVFGRIVSCGMISQYNAADPVAGPSNLDSIIPKRLSLRGFLVSDHLDMMPEFYPQMCHWIGEGWIKIAETFVKGIESTPKAFIGLFRGDNLGKMIVTVDA